MAFDVQLFILVELSALGLKEFEEVVARIVE
jgi:hypothetical protein